MDQLHESHVLGQLHRQEPVRLDAQAREEAPVGDGGEQEGDGFRRGIELAQRPRERVEQREVGLRRDGLVADHVELELHAAQGAQLGEHILGAKAREQPAVEFERHLIGDHVDLLAARDDRGTGGVVQQRIEHLHPLADEIEQAIGELRLEQPAQRQRDRRGKLDGDRLDHRADDRRHVHRQAPAIERAQELCELSHRTAGDRHRAVPRAPANRRPRPANLLLGDHDRVEAATGDLHREAAELPDRIAHAGEQLGVLGDEEARAEVAARLLVGEDAQDHIARRRLPARLRAHERSQHHRDAALHVQRAATPHVAAVELARERRPAPLPARRDDVDVALQQQRRARSASGQARDQVRALLLARDYLHLAAELLEQAAYPFDALALVARRVARVEAEQLLQQLDGAILNVRARHSRSLSDLRSA